MRHRLCALRILEHKIAIIWNFFLGMKNAYGFSMESQHIIISRCILKCRLHLRETVQKSIKFIVCLLLGNSKSEVYMPTFRNTLFHLHRTHAYLPVKMEVCSETSAYKLQTPGNYPKETIQHLEHGISLKSSIIKFTSWAGWKILGHWDFRLIYI
jgi:hypothetical protein